MRIIFLVGVGGFIGSVLRAVVSEYVQLWAKATQFPYGTLTVNIIGCLVIGLLSSLADIRGGFTAETRAFAFIGILGGFTTFSTFGNETVNLGRGGESGLALLNITTHLILGLGAVWLGRLLAYLIWK